MKSLVRRRLSPLLRSLIQEMRAEEAQEMAAVKKDLLATNHRVTWLEGQLAALQKAAENQ